MLARNLALIVAITAVASGCSKKPDQASLEREVKEYWAPCNAVEASNLKIVDAAGGSVRYEYTVKLLKNGADVAASGCPAANSTMLEALANEDLENLKAGVEVPVTQEKAL